MRLAIVCLLSVVACVSCQEICPVYSCGDIASALVDDCCPSSSRMLSCLSMGGSLECPPAFTYTACPDELGNNIYNISLVLDRNECSCVRDDGSQIFVDAPGASPPRLRLCSPLNCMCPPDAPMVNSIMCS
ncbi:PREDICTED: uncharacterized protein LOC106815669 [Priapulus caudatus]|uniref:Uncharacterized protein LOC106815669 n=1 Tax=Priapulus caudatus TaxID=37621 RepID=A0ABM1ETY1_PRICU|nr:PREDICTED: uncharacterized protein LOC106815669 [Priapulus caudatus]